MFELIQTCLVPDEQADFLSVHLPELLQGEVALVKLLKDLEPEEEEKKIKLLSLR